MESVHFSEPESRQVIKDSKTMCSHAGLRLPYWNKPNFRDVHKYIVSGEKTKKNMIMLVQKNQPLDKNAPKPPPP